jgi:hypothetical protein
MKRAFAAIRKLLGDGAASRLAPAGRQAAPDWNDVESYSELYRLVRQVRFADQAAFIDGPFARFLLLAAAARGAAGARIMEHAGASLRHFRGTEAAAGRATAELDAAAQAAVRACFASNSHNDAYMIEVFEGRATHNYRASAGDNDDDD